jgi:transposase-like protein
VTAADLARAGLHPLTPCPMTAAERADLVERARAAGEATIAARVAEHAVAMTERYRDSPAKRAARLAETEGISIRAAAQRVGVGPSAVFAARKQMRAGRP